MFSKIKQGYDFGTPFGTRKNCASICAFLLRYDSIMKFYNGTSCPFRYIPNHSRSFVKIKQN